MEFEIPIVITVDHLIGLDPKDIPESRLHAMVCAECLFICRSLFWTTQQIGIMKREGGWLVSEESLQDALERIGEIGEAVVNTAMERMEKLERLAKDGSEQEHTE